jgi:hypothetical protein
MITIVLPECMTPDGADPCKGYTELADKLSRFEDIVKAARRFEAENVLYVQKSEAGKRLANALRACPIT